MRIALFGGSFDPPHLGHVLAATYAFTMARVNEVWVMPVAKHAFNKPLSPWQQRWELCQAAFGNLSFCRLCDDELRNPDGYTISLIDQLSKRHPQHRWSLVGGTDTYTDLGKWHRGAELMERIDVITVPRHGYDDSNPGALPSISSTIVRDRLQHGGDVSSLVPVAVVDLIRKNRWYC
jgi:nicotinate-nucleotide adenylyltransferase